MELNIYLFSDGNKAYFLDDDKQNHILCPVGSQCYPDMSNVTEIKYRRFEGTYPRWKRRILKAENDKKGVVK